MFEEESRLFLGKKGRPALLFLHGFMGCKEDWLEMASFFSGKYYCILPDLPGHGRASFPVDMSGLRLAEELHTLLRREGYDQAAVCGYSMGGRLALICRESHPGIFSKMILESVLPGISSAGEREQRRLLDADRARRLLRTDKVRFLEEWYGQPLFKGLKESSGYRAMWQRRLQGDPQGWAKALEAFSSGLQADYTPWLKAADIPVLFLAGEWDQKYRSLAEKLRTWGANLETETLSACSHNAHLMQPQEFRLRIDRFLRK